MVSPVGTAVGTVLGPGINYFWIIGMDGYAWNDRIGRQSVGKLIPLERAWGQTVEAAGFGANRDEIEARVANGYEAVVEELLHPVDDAYLERDIVDRYYIEIEDQRKGDLGQRLVALPHDQYPQPAAGKDDAVLARPVRHRI